VHGTAKWLGRDSIAIAREVHASLAEIERGWTREPDPLFTGYPITRPITVDQIRGGAWQGMVCDRCELGGYLELLPLDDIEACKATLERELRAELSRRGVDPPSVEVAFSEQYAGHRLDPRSPLCDAAEAVLASAGLDALDWAGTGGFNSGCEAGVRASLHGTPTLVWGPGDLAHAHAVDEHVKWEDVERAAGLFASLAERWCIAKECA
jgi:acetylornithine deacetylase